MPGKKGFMNLYKKLTKTHLGKKTDESKGSLNKNKFNALIKERPRFHGRENAGTEHYAITDEVLHWIFENVKPGGVTLETGCGYSTLVFTMLGGSHTVISPFPQEHLLLKKWCISHNIPIGNTEFIAAISQDVIPGLGKTGEQDLDMVLIDGDHAFPGPFIDWYYTADRVKQGGYVIVDDTQLITGKILRDFLLDDHQRWELEIEMRKTAVFKKIVSEPVARGIPWIKQPYVNEELKKNTHKEEVS